MLEMIEPSLGIFTLGAVPEAGKPIQLILKLDYYQSNCFRMWLDMRWQASCLSGSSIHAVKPNELVISKLKDPQNELPTEVLKNWRVQVLSQFKLYLSSRT